MLYFLDSDANLRGSGSSVLTNNNHTLARWLRVAFWRETKSALVPIGWLSVYYRNESATREIACQHRALVHEPCPSYSVGVAPQVANLF